MSRKANGISTDFAAVDDHSHTNLTLNCNWRIVALPHNIPASMTDELGAWNNGEGIPLETWVECEGDFRLAVGYAAALWPKFEAVGKYILVEGCKKENILGFENQENSTPKGVEWVLNHLHLADLHIHDANHISADKLLFLGNILKEMWEAKLQFQFPNRPCTVEFFVPEDPADFWEYQLSFWQTAWDKEE